MFSPFAGYADWQQQEKERLLFIETGCLSFERVALKPKRTMACEKMLLAVRSRRKPSHFLCLEGIYGVHIFTVNIDKGYKR